MEKAVKIVLISIATVIVFTLLVAGSLLLWFDPNDYRAEIVAAVKQRTGRDLVVEGDLTLSLVPWLRIAAGKLSLVNAEGFAGRPFAAVEESEIDLNPLPLLTKRLDIGRIVLKNGVVNLARNQDGRTNWQDLMAGGEANIPSLSAPGGALSGNGWIEALAIGGIYLENAEISWDDRQSGQRLTIKNLIFNMGRFTMNEPVAVGASFRVLTEGAQPDVAVKMAASLSVTENYRRFSFKRCELQITAEDDGLPGQRWTAALTTDATVDIADRSVKLVGLRFTLDDVKIAAEFSGRVVKEQPSFQGTIKVEPFNLVGALAGWDVELPDMGGRDALKKLAIAFDVQGAEDSADFKNVSMNLDGSRIEGTIRIKHFARPAVDFQLMIDTLDADRYLPPRTQQYQPMTHAASAMAVGMAKIPLENLRKLNAHGAILLQKLNLGGFLWRDVIFELNGNNLVMGVARSKR